MYSDPLLVPSLVLDCSEANDERGTERPATSDNVHSMWLAFMGANSSRSLSSYLANPSIPYIVSLAVVQDHFPEHRKVELPSVENIGAYDPLPPIPLCTPSYPDPFWTIPQKSSSIDSEEGHVHIRGLM